MFRSFQIHSSDSDTLVTIQQTGCENSVYTYRIDVSFPDVRIPSPIQILWEEDMLDLLHVWTAGAGFQHMHQWFSPTANHSRFCCGAPILCTMGEHGRNRQTVSVSDVNSPIELRFYIKDLEQRDKVGYGIQLFSQKCDAIQNYSTQFRIDCRDIPYYESIQSVNSWWKSCGYIFPACPKEAEDPLYSSWYNFHQAPEQHALLQDLKIASQLGFKTVILDDGWQFDGPSTGNYATCGEWTVAESKFPDFKGFSDQVHDLGMKLIVWFAVPFIGEDSSLYSRFQGKYLSYSKFNHCATLDPRYPEVRQYLIDTYRNFLIRYNIDGFKLDFIDSFQPGELTREYNPALMDCQTTDEAVQKLLTEIESDLSKIKSNLLFEYRQFYIGPAINRFGNMLRVCDCAYESHYNKLGMVNLRLLNYPIAIHSDMLLWSREERISLCARQLLNILFSVPQISVLLANSTEEQKQLLQHFNRYWLENRQILLHGRFIPLHPELNYSQISAESDRKRITVLYGNTPLTWDGMDWDIFLNAGEDDLFFENPTNTPLHVIIFDHFGNEIQKTTIEANSLVRLNVGNTGMARIFK